MAEKTEIAMKFREHSLTMGRMIGYSKSEYRAANPGNDVLFNANIFVLGEGKVWWGDIDITKDYDKLEKIASELGKDIFILKELAGRFENETVEDSEIVKNAHLKIAR